MNHDRTRLHRRNEDASFDLAFIDMTSSIMKRLTGVFPMEKEAEVRHFKRDFLWLCVLSVVFAPALLRAEDSAVSIRLWGGMTYLLAQDVNDGNKGRNDLIISAAALSGWSASGNTNPIRTGNEFGGDLIIPFTPRIGIGFGAGYVQGTKGSDIAFSKGSSGLTMTSTPDIAAIPLRAGLFLNLPLGEKACFTANAGAAYYLSKYSYEWKMEGAGYWDDVDRIAYEVSANGLGFHGGIGLEFDLAANLVLFIEGQGRHAKIGGFSGTIEKHYKEGWTYSGEGNLYAYDLKYGASTLKQLDVREAEPSGSSVSNVREANVDFSGLYAVAGIKIRF
ncbi:MAG: hypothetical protein FJY81_03515 [Candidatus Aminicenantes bacterium]|nr:hypothetical protein [Candidatus Aminicenantes bacterium]